MILTFSIVKGAAVFAATVLIQVTATSAMADPADQPTDLVDPTQDLSALSLEELAEVDVTSVSRSAEPLARAAAAIFVINAEDIRRSGAASLPEILRLAPNLQVQRANAADYAISSRGFGSFETANKLLVLIDGRSVYTTLFSGVLWDAQGLVLEDIERIEVISGPGGTLYGANAVNGVINITTRSARDTIGSAASVGVGNEDRTLSLRQGGRLGDAGAWRAFFTAFDRKDSLALIGDDSDDANSGHRGGFRADFSQGPNDWTIQGEAYNHHNDFRDATLRGSSVQATLRRTLGRAGDLQLRAYLDGADRDAQGSDETVQTLDLSLQHRWTRRNHALVWGADYRVVENSLTVPANNAALLDPPERRITLASLFAQDQISLSQSLRLTVGAKVEDSSFTGLEVLPSVSLAWTTADGGLLWGSVSRAARTASRIDRELVIPGLLAVSDFDSEKLTAYEVGYRAIPFANASFSINAFFHDYDGLRTVSPTPVTFLPIRFANGGEGHTYGVEAWGSYDLKPGWRLSAGLNTLEKDFQLADGQSDISGLASVGDDPAYQLFVASRSNLTDRLELDVRLRAVDDLPALDTDGYVEADVRLGWRLTDGVEIAIQGSNLLGNRRIETGDSDDGRRRAFGRSVYATLRAGF